METGWECTGGTTTSKDTCVDKCGDGKVMKTSASYCDDGNKVSGDGCSSTCAPELGWTCTPGDASTASTCTEDCGDSKKMTTDVNKCDDGNRNPLDGCSATCTVEAGWSCTGGTTTTKDTCVDD